jgi:hypothetical protein
MGAEFEQGSDRAFSVPIGTVEIVRFTKSDGPLTKRIYLAEDGSARSDGSACVMPRGFAERFPISDIGQFGDLIGGLKSNEAIALGALRAGLSDEVKIATKRALNGSTRSDVIARTESNIVYKAGQSALALIDFDTKGMPEDVQDRLGQLGGCWPALLSVVPSLELIARVTRASTSAGLYRIDTGAAVPGSNGQHIYIAVRDGADAERFLKALHERCWLNGLGWMMIGAGGQLLERSIVDRMVGAPERLVFEGAPILVKPLAQDREARQPVVIDGEMLDTLGVCPPLTVREKALLQELRAKEAHRLTGDSARARAAFIDKQSQQLVERAGISRQVAKDIIGKQCEGTLLPHIALPFDDEQLADKTVADVLADPERFDGETLADPLEGVEYGRGKAKIMRRADGALWINSFAHGRAVYDLKLDASAVRAAIDAAAKEEVVSIFVRLALQAELDAAETECLVAAAAKRSGNGIRAIVRSLKSAHRHAAQQCEEQEKARRRAERTDPRPEIAVPALDAPYLPQIDILNDVLGNVKALEPPMRNRMGVLTQVRMREPTAMHAFGRQMANAEEALDVMPAPKQYLLTEMSEAEVAELIERDIDFVDDAGRSVHLPSLFVRHYIKRDDKALPTVVAIATLPLILADGAVLAQPGLERDCGILFKLPRTSRAIVPGESEYGEDAVAEALRFLTDEWLVDVATNYVGKCILVAAGLTIIERSLLPDRPAFFVTAGHRGGGKTTTLEMLSVAAIGTLPAAAAWSPNEEERRKALLSHYIDGVPFILWDNIPRGSQISCPHIERSCTAAFYSDRKLGVSELVEVPAFSAHLFTGNNISAKGDLASRSLQVRLEVDRIDPENREFEHSDPIGWTERNRAKILRSLYTILLGNPQLAKSSDAAGKTRFKVWWRLVGSAVEHAAQCAASTDPELGEVPDQVLDFGALFLNQEADEEDAASLADALDALATRMGAQGKTVFKASDVCHLINAPSDELDATVRGFFCPSLASGTLVTPKAITKALNRHIGEPVRHGDETLTLKSMKDAHDKTLRFFVESR